YILTPFQVILDYFIPYLSLILVAVVPFSKKKHSALLSEGKKTFSAHWGFFVGAILYIVVRYTSHVLSGAIFFAEYAWEGWGAWPYSMVYNLFAVLDAGIAIGAGSALFSNETFNSFMAKSFNAKKNADACAEND
ncbi:MAG: energy-coupled thiamine transporter ThiT, partial [Clostridia bacterium]|nr:energy-coupled thiamine transporter ThiT [Clostridia bacterium]